MKVRSLFSLLLLLLFVFPASKLVAGGGLDPVIAAVPENGLQFYYRLVAEYKAENKGKLPTGTLYCTLRVDEKGDHLMKTINSVPSKEFVVFVQKRFNDLKFLPARDGSNRPMISEISFSVNFDGNTAYDDNLTKGLHYKLEPQMEGWQAEKRAYYDAFISAKKEKLPKGSIPSTSASAAPDKLPAPKNMDKVRSGVGFPDGLSDTEKDLVQNKLRYRVLVAPNGDFVACEPLHEEVLGLRALLAESVSHNLTELKCTPAQKDGKNVYAWLTIPFLFN